MKVAFYIAGAVLEVFGILLLGLPDFLPYGERLSAWLSGRYRRGINRFRQLIHRPRPQVVYLQGVAAEGSASARASIVKRVGAGVPLDQQIALLREHDEETQKGLTELRGRLEDLESGTSQRFEESRAAMEDHVTGALAMAGTQYRALRVAGAVLLIIGVGLSTAGNLLS